jgi:mannose-1-phosphate guanylyltransferase/mannose-6-phosphate isomerase
MSERGLPSNVYAVILAGGSGTRFWPKSRQKWPKQLCALGGSQETMLEITLGRLDGFVPPERRLIVTHKDQAEATKKIVGSRCPVVVAEPEARNTANALALAALEIENMGGGPDAIMVSLHADHVVEKLDVFRDCLRTAVKVAGGGEICLIGIVPKYAETGYGYIERGVARAEPGAFKVASFREKPERKVAEEFVASNKFYWNAGLFVFPVATLLKELESKLPATVQGLRRLAATSSSLTTVNPVQFAEAYALLPKISIDHAVLEVSKLVSVVEADIGWQDVGSWDALSECFETDGRGNFVQGDVMLIDAHGCTVDSDGPMTALLGVRDLVVVHAKGAILVCPKNRAQDVKLIVDRLKEIGRVDLT